MYQVKRAGDEPSGSKGRKRDTEREGETRYTLPGGVSAADGERDREREREKETCTDVSA